MPSMSAFASSSGDGSEAFEPRFQVELGEVADVRVVEGPSMIKSENGMLLADEVIDVFLPVLFFQVERRRWRRIHCAASAPIATA